LRGQRENGAPVPRLNNAEVLRQQMSWPQVWSRRQKMSQQQAPVEPAPIKRVERTNTVMMYPN